MASHQRKLLPLPKINSFEKTQVLQVKYYVVNCTDECSDAPSPLIVINDNQLNENHPISPILIPMFCILGAAFILVCYLTLVQKYRSNLYNTRRRNPPVLDNTHEDFFDENHGPIVDHHVWFINTVGLQQSVIDSISTFNYKRDEGLIEGSECSVCLSEFQEDESLRLLPKCNHAFHIPCIDTWLRSHKNCPLCRAPIVCDSNNADLSTEDTDLNEFGSRVETPVERLESHQGGEDGNNDMGVGAENFGALPIEEGKICANLEKNSRYLNARNYGVRVVSDLADHSAKVEEELQQVRRSISMDSSAASMIYLAVANIRSVVNEGCSDNQLAQAKKPNSKKVAKRGNRSNSSI